jgi:uncharacterized protein (TIGR02145 family)
LPDQKFSFILEYYFRGDYNLRSSLVSLDSLYIICKKINLTKMKKIILSLFLLLFMGACKKDLNTIVSNENDISFSAKTENKASARTSSITICHYNGSKLNTYSTLVIQFSTLSKHLEHGDIIPDADGDGYTKVNPCGNGMQNDCNDNNAAINPGVVEKCDNNIDDNCNGQIDEGCIASVLICNKTWMLKNLDVSTYRNGDPIPEVTDPTAWFSTTTGAWCYYNNDPANGAVYGKLYNWYAVNDPRGLAPVGWHVPTDVEWTDLVNCQGGFAVAGGKLKEAGLTHWDSPNTSATNSSGFTALAGGNLSSIGMAWYNKGLLAVFWTSTPFPFSTNAANYHRLFYNSSTVSSSDSGGLHGDGMSVRCVKD